MTWHPGEATPNQLLSRAAELDQAANDNAHAGLRHAAHDLRAEARTLRKLAREAIEFHQRYAA